MPAISLALANVEVASGPPVVLDLNHSVSSVFLLKTLVGCVASAPTDLLMVRFPDRPTADSPMQW